MSTLIAIAAILIAGALQARLPSLWWLGSLRLEFLPAIVVYVAFTMHRQRALLLALVAGLVQDSLSAAPFGISVLTYGIAAVMVTGLREVLDRDLPWVQFGAGALTSIGGSILAFFSVGISFGAILKMWLIALSSGVSTMMLFFVVDFSRMIWRNT